MSFTANDQSIYDLFSRNCYRMPKNQRRYVWKHRNLQELYDDIILVMNGFEQSHFIGSIVLSQEKDRENGISLYTVIDGQQRITSLSILIACIGYWLKIYNAQSEFDGLKKYLIARDDSNQDHIIVSLDSHLTLETITKAIIITPSIELKKKSKKIFIAESSMNTKDDKVADAFSFFIDRIEETLKGTIESPTDFLIKLRDVLLHRIRYVNIIATKEEDAYTIFEILNARGALLEDHELLKNYIMRGIEDEYGIESVKTAWTALENGLGKHIHRFFYHYTIHKYKGNSKEFDGNSDYKIIQMKNKGSHTHELLTDIISKSELYVKIIEPNYKGDKANCSEEEYKLFSFLKSRRQEQFRPLLLSLIHQNSIGVLSNKNYNVVLSFLYVFFICYNIIGEETSNKISNIVNGKAYELENNYSDELLCEMMEKLCNKLPKKDSFKDAFKRIGWSHHDNYYNDDKFKYKVQIILEVFECYKSPNDKCDDFTIEHIVDDNLGDEYALIGNLIPLEESLNKQCSGKSFEEKIKIYKKSGFASTRAFAERYVGKTFGEKEITERSEKISDEFFNKILHFKDTDSIIKKIRISKRKNEADKTEEYTQLSFL